MNVLKIKAPAKINIGLTVVTKRPDGYHDLHTFFYPIKGLYDTITIERREKGTIFQTFNKELAYSPNNNLIIKAHNLLEKTVKKKLNVKIRLDKRIPIGAGLGGGSSDAAATLLGLNEFFSLNLSEKTLKRLAIKLGADVPFFLNPVPSLAYGRGENLEPINISIPHPILLVYPNIHISTKTAFSTIIPAYRIPSIPQVIEEHGYAPKIWRRYIYNDFENGIFDTYEILKKIKIKMLQNGALFSLMTGTGSTIFGIFPTLEKAEEIRKKFEELFFTHIEYGNEAL
jgi:4-diphosphocytidyl-2-C-methyl-D-erythritol kinase